MKKLISIITPTFNEEGNIEKLCLKISEEISKTDYDYEHIVIDNDSNDKTVDILKKIAIKNKNLKIIINARNFGHIKSPIHGMLQCNGEAAILMSADFQDPPEMIGKYIAEWKKGYDVVLGQKENTKDNLFKNSMKKIFYKSIKLISEVPLMLDTTGAGLFDRKIIEQVRSIDDPYPYFRGLISEITSNIKLIKFDQPKRLTGKTKNNFYSLYDIGILGIIKHSKIPLRIMTFLGFFTSMISIFISLVFLLRKIFFWDSFDLGIAPLIVGLFAIASIQIFLLGFIGEYVMNILTQTRKLPLVIEKERINF
jgi:glycosyltransferase involved in cell wall biosynthesis|tara:strand:- start:3444 stop:4373 length:930 start_codon:yes stop_codon:yes gene_type:complete